jgi:hypothetical protein
LTATLAFTVDYTKLPIGNCREQKMSVEVATPSTTAASTSVNAGASGGKQGAFKDKEKPREVRHSNILAAKGSPPLKIK